MKRNIAAGVSVLVLLCVSPHGAAAFCLHVLLCVVYLKSFRRRREIIQTVTAGFTAMWVLVPYILTLSWSNNTLATVPSALTIGMVYNSITSSMLENLCSKKEDMDDDDSFSL